MSWTRLDDNWYDQMVAKQLSVDAICHYLCLIQICSKTGEETKYSGVIAKKIALRAGNVDDTESAIRELVNAELVKETSDGYQLLEIDRHLPPKYMRDKQRKESQTERQHRSRAHKAGDHSLCLPDGKCPAVTGPVTRDTWTETGQDGTGPALEVSTNGGDHPPVPAPRTSPARSCSSCGGWGDPDGCVECGAVGVGLEER